MGWQRLNNSDGSIFLGNIYPGHHDGYAGAVFAVNGMCPAIKANSGGNSQPIIVVKYEERNNKVR